MRHLTKRTFKRGRGASYFWGGREPRRERVHYYRWKEGRRRRLIMIVLAVASLSILVILGAIFVPQATIRDIEVILPPDRVSDASIVEAAARSILAERKMMLSRGHLLTFSSRDLEQRLMAQLNYPAINIRRLGLLKISLEPIIPRPTFRLLSGLVLDQTGRKLVAVRADPKLLLIEAPESLISIPPWLAARISDLVLQVQPLNLTIERIALPEGVMGPMRAYTKDGWYLALNHEISIALIAERLQTLMINEFAQKTPKEYVDLRFGERVIYK